MLPDDLVYGIPGERIVILFYDPVRVITQVDKMADCSTVGEIADKILKRFIEVLVFHTKAPFTK